MKEPSRAPGILRPGASGWELWRAGPPAEKLDTSLPYPQKLIVAPPTHSLLALPLWISPNGEPEEIVELELASRHLFRKGQALSVIELERNQDRVLVLGILGSDDPTLEEPIKQAYSFEIPACLFHVENADVVLWKEDAKICYAYYRNGHCAYFSTSGEETLSGALADVIVRGAQRLQAEEILPNLPSRALVSGDFTPSEANILSHHTGWHVELTQDLPPKLPAIASDAAPPAARLRRVRQKQLKKTGQFAGIAAAIYALVLLAVGILLFVGYSRLTKAKSEVEALRLSAGEARAAVERWRAIRPAVDPKLYALDLLAAVAAALPAETVRVTSFNFEGRQLTVTGEASEVAQTYEMMERLKNSPALSEFDWTAGPPDIASKNVVRFQFQGRSPDAVADTN